jgi:hypothetical protein
MNRALALIVFATCLTASAALGQAGPDLSETVTLSTGYMSYGQAGVDPKTGTNSSNLGLEWAHFTKKDLAVYSAYRIAQDSASKRTLYQAGSAGVRYFPRTLGMPIGSFRNLSVVKYDFSFKPHVDMGLVMGRYLVNTVFNLDAADYSSEFWGVALGGGVTYGIAERYALDLKASYEYDVGYGPLDFTATTLFVLLGMVYYI